MNRRVYLNLPQIGRETGSEVNYRCPVCDKTKLYWNSITHLGTCFSCDRGYNIFSIKKIATLNYMKSFADDMNMSLEPVEPVAPRYQFEPMRNGVGFEHQLEARAFLLAEKKLMPTVIDEHLYYSPPTREVGVPLHHCFGGESTWMRRSIDRKGWFVDVNTDKKDFLYYVPARTRFPQGEIIYLVEGVFDALSLSPFASAISLLGTTLYEAQAACLKKKVELNGGLPVFVWMDPDKAGQKASTQILFQLKYELGIEAKVLMQNNEPNDLSPDVLHQIVVSGIKSYLPTTNHTYDPMRKVRN